ncbi:DUF397 domain-containing protein [Streptomyces sp. NPDC015350]|uniref:DUF397 domain-containing protein n=1 Tax=Streptomyces sp. NPDC015350 TaxID=3364955 RepID=UPI0036FBC4FD
MTTRAEKEALYATDITDAVWLAAPGSSPDDRFELAHLPGGAVALRQTKDPDGTVLRYTAAEWNAYLNGAADREFDDDLQTPSA